MNIPKDPGKTVKVDLILSSREEHFIGKNHLTCSSSSAQGTPEIPKTTRPQKIVGIDVNRVSEHLLAATIELGLKTLLEDDLKKWHSLEEQIARLQKKAARTRHWKHMLKLNTEIALLHRRRAHIREEIFVKARTQLGRLLASLDTEFVGVECNLERDAKDTKSGLAKAITSIPDNVDLVARALLAVNLRFNRHVRLVQVRKEGTSRYHHECGGMLSRSGDTATCRKCGEVVADHLNAAENIKERAVKIVTSIILIPFLTAHLPSAHVRGRNHRTPPR